MKRLYFSLILSISVLLGAASAVLIHQDTGSMRLAAALTGLSGFLFIGYARDRKTSLSDLSQVNMELNISEELFELLLVGSLLATSMVPQRLGVTVLATLIFLKVFIDEAGSQLNTELSSTLGRSYRIYTVLAAISLSILNTQYLFFSAFLLLGIVVYDLGQVFYQFNTNKQGIKLKNRILSK